MTTLYHYNAQTGMPVGESIADVCQVTGEPLVPAYATLKPWPAVASGFVCRFSVEDNDWIVEASPAGEALPEPTAQGAAPTQEQRQAAMIAAVQEYMDAKARSWGYDSIFTAVSYAAFPSEDPQLARFHSEGIALGNWRSAVWATCFAIQAEVLAGKRPEPTVQGLLELLPLAPARPDVETSA